MPSGNRRAAWRRTWTRNSAKTSKAQKRRCLPAQRGWIAYRDGQCELAGFEARGGSMEPMLVSGCLADLTRKRTKELKEFIGEGEAQ